MAGINKRWTPENWASLVPFGIGEQRPNNFAEVFRAAWENRDNLPYAWRILNDGVCDGCALGTSGMTDWTLPGTHLCNIRLRLLRLNTMAAVDPARLAHAAALRALSGADLRAAGRLARPMIRRKGDPGFSPVSWDEALDLAAARIAATHPARWGVYLTSRGMGNENYYAVQKAVRAMGSNNIDNAARVCHSPSSSALKAAIGAAVTTCSYSDWIESDLIVFVGSNVANNQPVATKYLHYAKKNGAKIACINAYREPGMERYWIPSVPESALFGTKLADRFFLIHTGADIAFLNGALKALIERGHIDRAFIDAHTSGFDDLAAHLAAQPWEDIERAAGLPRVEIEAFAQMLAEARKAVFVWSMGVTQHVHGHDNVHAIVNLALSRGFVGRPGCGLMPIRGHSGVQGGAEMGAYATAFPGGKAVTRENAEALSEAWGFAVPAKPGLNAVEMIDAAHRGELDVLVSAGGNFLDVLPDPVYVEEALQRIPLRIHMDIVLSPQMLVDPAETVLLLPAATRYESPGGVTETSTERRVIFSPEIPGPRPGDVRPEWQVFAQIARRVRPELAARFDWDAAGIREEIAAAVPFYEGIQHLRKKGDQFQYGGPHLCAGGVFPTPDGRAQFVRVSLRRDAVPEGAFLVTTRRGKQFNSMVHESRDAITGALRQAVFMNADDAARLGLREGDAVLLTSAAGTFRGRIHTAQVKPGNLQIHWPEGNVLIDRTKRSPDAGVPDYNAVVTVERIT